MAELTTPQIHHAAELLVNSVRVLRPDSSRDAFALFEAEASRWDAARIWEGPGALVVLTNKVNARWGAPEANLHVLTDGRPATVQWFTALLEELAEVLPPAVSCRVSSERRELLEPLRQLGLGISKMGLGGDVATMVQRISQMSFVDPTDLGLRLALVSTITDVRACSNLRRDYFVAHPEHGWASELTEEEQSAIDERVEREFQARLDASNGTDFMLLRGEQLVAAFGLTSVQTSAVVGRAASFNICLAPEVQRQGLGLYAYRVMIARAAEMGVEELHGSTSNPGVLHIGAKIGRRIDNYLLRREPPWLDNSLAELLE